MEGGANSKELVMGEGRVSFVVLGRRDWRSSARAVVQARRFNGGDWLCTSISSTNHGGAQPSSAAMWDSETPYQSGAHVNRTHFFFGRVPYAVPLSQASNCHVA